MEKRGRYIGKWELGCMAFNVCIYKMFTAYPTRFKEISGSAGWITAAFCGAVFLGVLFLLLVLAERIKAKSLFEKCREKGGYAAEAVLRVVLAVYWIIAAAYALCSFAEALHAVAYVNSPKIFLMFFVLLGAAVLALYGARAVYRLHSLMVLFVGLTALIIGLLSFKSAHMEYLAPVFGNGLTEVLGKGLATMFLYADIIFVFLLIPYCRPEVNVKKSVMTGAGLAAAVNVLLVLAFTATGGYGIDGANEIPVYMLTKLAYTGKFWSRIDAGYLAAFITSGMLYVSLALHMVSVCCGRVRIKKTQITSGIMAVIMCFLLTGCYDSREVEEGAYMIALGVDKGITNAYRYTFQVSNPLELGENSEAGGMGEDKTETEEAPQEVNKGVNNIVVEADDFYTAMDILKSRLGKAPEPEHLKLAAFSKELAAEESLKNHAALLYCRREVRPGISLCLADSAEEFLTGVKPELEQSTARYYELFFREENTPYAPVIELKDFVIESDNDACDSVLPIGAGKELTGMGIFHDGILVSEADPYQAMLYKLLTGRSQKTAVSAGDSVFSVTADKPAEITFDSQSKRVIVKSNLTASLAYGTLEDGGVLVKKLETDMTSFLAETAQMSADILGIRQKLKQKAKTQDEWDTLKEENPLNMLTICSKIDIKIVDFALNLQKG